MATPPSLTSDPLDILLDHDAWGTRLLLDDGALALIVESTTDTDVVCRVVDGGLLGERKGINLPGVALPIDSLTEKDIEDLKWAVGQNADYIALSFVRRASDCERAKQLISEAAGRARGSAAGFQRSTRHVA